MLKNEKAYYDRFPHARRLDGFARDAKEDDFERAASLIEGGVPVLAKWCSENLSRRDVEKLIAELNTVLSKRVEETITADSGRGKRRDGRSADPSIRAVTDRVFADFRAGNTAQEYHDRFPDARRLGAGVGGVAVATAKPISGNATTEAAYSARFPDAHRLAK